MKYRIASETKNRIRIWINSRKLSEEQAKILKYAFSRATDMFSAHSPGLPTPAFVTNERLQLRQPIQRRMSSG